MGPFVGAMENKGFTGTLSLASVASAASEASGLAHPRSPARPSISGGSPCAHSLILSIIAIQRYTNGPSRPPLLPAFPSGLAEGILLDNALSDDKLRSGGRPSIFTGTFTFIAHRPAYLNFCGLTVTQIRGNVPCLPSGLGGLSVLCPNCAEDLHFCLF